jgi:putative colanic acid biosynthesis acetyltransferase WcaF
VKYKVQDLHSFRDKNPSMTKPLLIISFSLWYVLSFLYFSTPLPGSKLRILLLRLFGAKIGSNCVVKPSVKVKHPWLLRIGHSSWIGESVNIDNIFPVVIGSSTCLSQNVYVCAGNHDFRSTSFDYIKKITTIHGQCWICARSTISPGSIVNRCTVVGIGSTVKGSLEPYSIYYGNPIRLHGPRSQS